MMLSFSMLPCLFRHFHMLCQLAMTPRFAAALPCHHLSWRQARAAAAVAIFATLLSYAALLLRLPHIGLLLA